jgi:hypothetical protein
MAALVTGIMAIAISDKRPNKIDFKYQIFGNKTKIREPYELDKLSNSIKTRFKKYGEKFYSYQIYFKITNTSDFTLDSPTITIRVPTKVQHPSQDCNSIELRSNMYNSTQNLQMLEFGNTIVISNSNLPYLNPTEDLKVWIRMLLDEKDESTIHFKISVNAKNAEGQLKRISMSPKEIFDATES